MKKLALLLISLVLIFGIIGCNNDVNKPSKTELPSVELPSEFNPDKDGEQYEKDPSQDKEFGATIQELMNLFPKNQETPNEDVMAIANSLISAAMEKGIALTLPKSNGNTLSVEVKGSMSEDLIVTYNIVANVNYSFSNVSVTGKVVGSLKFDSSKFNTNVPNQYSEESSSESPYKFELDKETDLKITVDGKNYSIAEFDAELKNENSTIKPIIAKAIQDSYKQLINDALTMVANFFKEGYSIDTDKLSISIKGDLKYVLATPNTGDNNINPNYNYYYQQFGNFFEYIALENIVLDIKTKDDIDLSGTIINGHIIVGVEYAKLEPAKETVWVPAEYTFKEIDGIKASISFDVSGALNINIGEKTHEIYAKGHFKGISGASNGNVEGYGREYSLFVRFDGKNYNLTPMIESLEKPNNPSEGNEE